MIDYFQAARMFLVFSFYGILCQISVSVIFFFIYKFHHLFFFFFSLIQNHGIGINLKIRHI